MILTSLAEKTASKGGGEFGIAVADQEPPAPTGVVKVHAEVAGLLGQPRSGGMCGDAEDVYAAGGVHDGEEHILNSSLVSGP